MLVTLDGIVTDVSPLQPENAESPTLVTPSLITKFVTEEKSMPHFHPGTVTVPILLHPLNTEFPMLVTLSGIVTDINPPQLEKA